MAGKLMRSVQYSSYGGGSACLKHVEGPIPEPKGDELLVKVQAVSLNPSDWKIHKGMVRPFLPRKFPFTPGTDVAGEVVKVGSNVTKYKAGDQVVAWLHLAGGGLAEYAVAKENLTTIRPPQVSAADAAGLPLAALTAHQVITQACGIRLDGTGDKKNILITAASGGVGHYTIQLARLGNTHVTATCGARNIDLVKALGADEVIDYNTPHGTTLTSPSGKKYDYVIHCAPGVAWSTFEPNLSANGRVIHLTPNLGAMWTFLFKKLTLSKKQLILMILIDAKSKNLEFLMNLVMERKLKTILDSSYPMGRVGDAWERIMSGHATGKIIVKPWES